MTWRVICDFDGTISKKDTTDQLLARFADPVWQAIEAEWEVGSIGSAECMRRQIELLHVSKTELDTWLAQIEIDHKFVAFVKTCEQFGIDISIASDGIDYVIRSVLAHHGLNHLRVTANKLIFLDEGRYTLTSYNTEGVCESGSGVCKCRVAELTQFGSQPILYVGDGRSDFCVSQNVDLVLAKSKLLTFCQEQELPHIAFDDFGDMKSVLMNLILPSRERSIQPEAQAQLVLA